MKVFNFLILIFLTNTAMAVNPLNDIRVGFGKSNAIIIPSPATTLSCGDIASGKISAGSIGGGYFTLPAPDIKWAGDQQLSEVRIDAIVFRINSKYINGGDYKCVHAGPALGSMFYRRMTNGSTIQVQIWDQKLGLYSQNTVTSTSELKNSFNSCDIICGGLAIPYDAPKFAARGTWELFGVNRQYEALGSQKYNEYPLRVRGQFKVQNVID